MRDRASKTDTRQAGRAMSWWLLAGAGVFSQVLTTVSGVLVARMLGVEGRGEVVLVATLAAMASQLTLGGSLPNAITKQLAERGVTARDGLKHLPRRWAPWGLLAAFVAGGYLVFVMRNDPGTTKYALAGVLVVIAIESMCSRILLGSMLGEGTKPVHIAMTGVLPQAVVVTVFSFAVGLGVEWNSVQALAVTAACTGLVLLGRLRLLTPRTGRDEDRLDHRELIRLARRTHIGSVGPIDGLALDRVLVGTLLGGAALGLYSAAFALGGLTSIFGVCLGLVALPRVAVLQTSPAEEIRFVRRWLLLSVVILGGVVAGMQIVLEPAIRLTFGPEFLAATDCARWTVVGSGLLGLRRVLIAILQGRDRGKFASITEFVLTAVVVGGIVLSAAADSLVGIGITMTVVGALGCATLGVAVARSKPRGVPTVPPVGGGVEPEL